MNKAVIMARGLGTRMKKTDEAANLDKARAAVAETGVKAMIPIDRPFLDYVISTLADAGYEHICLVIGPEHDVVRNYYTSKVQPTRVSIDFAIQAEPKGTADAVAAAEPFAAGDPFLVINSDNYYPAEALAGLRQLDTPGLAVFSRAAMIHHSNVDPERITKFAVVQTNADQTMQRIIEKPDAQILASLGDSVGISMNCWRFDRTIFEACRLIKPSPRGEYELPDAVSVTMQQFGVKYVVQNYDAPVLDMSSRADIEPVATRLRGMKVIL